MHEPIQLKMTLPRIPDIELVALEGLERLSRYLGIADEKIGEARIIVTEAIINAFEHGGDKLPVAEVEFTLTQKEVIIFVRDFGEGFEPSAVETPTIEAKLKAENKRGWGLNLMKSLSDDFRIESDSHGTKITIRKLLV